MRSKPLMILAVAIVLGGAAFSLGFAGKGERSGCPGKVDCPVTGETVCKDRCPLFDVNRSDCPGKVECPLTGDFVCRDACPVGASTAPKDDNTVRSCCRHKARNKTK